MKKILFSIIALFTCVFAHSQITDVDGIYYRLLEDTTVANTNGLTAAVFTNGDLDHYKGNITIPSSVVIGSTEYPVTTITEMAFRGCRQLTSISIPASVIRIPSGAFYGCSNLTTITVDSGNSVYDSRESCNAVVETATNTIIAGCKNSTFPTSVSTIGECAFYGCMGITSFTIPSNISIIESWAFLDCSGLLSLNVPPTVTEFGTNVFLGCNNIQTLEWNSKYSPALVAGQSYPSLKSVVLGDEVTILLPYTFSNCTALESVELSPNLTRISQYAFKNCNSLTSISFPSGLNFIDSNAFQGCDNIETVYWNFRDSIAMARVLASASSNIKKVIIGKDITCIEGRAFTGFTNLTSIEVDPANRVYDSRNDCNAIIEKETGSLIIGCKTTTIPNDIKRLESGAFSVCGGPDVLTLPSSLLSIGAYAFSGCTGLTSVTIPENVSNIGWGVTADCPDITSITVHPDNAYYNSRENCNSIINTRSNVLIAGCKNSVIPAGVTKIDKEAFSGCYGLNSIEIPSSVTNIEYMAFYNCSGLNSIDLSGDVQRIGPSAFAGCTGLTSVKMPARMESIDAGAFYGCSNLLSFSIPQGIRFIAERVFENCDTLATVEIPSTVDSIASYAFRNCRSLQSVTIPEGVTIINDETFLGCSSLSYLSIPSTIKEFGWNVYQGCDNLQSAGPKGGGYNYEYSWRDTIPANAFYTLKSLKSVYIPKTVKAVYEFNNFDGSLWVTDANLYPSAVFHGCDNLESVAVSFTDTKLIRNRIIYYTGVSFYVEFPMDYHLYKTNGIKSLTILDDTIKTLSDKLTSQIKEVVISEYVKDIYPGAFSFDPYSVTFDYRFYPLTFNLSSNMDDIVVDNGNTNFTSIGGVLFSKDGSNLIAYPAGRKGAYRIPASAVNITEYSFKNSDGLTSISIPASVKQISDRAFEGCDSLTDVVIDGTPIIGQYAFQGCDNITSVSSRSEVPGQLVLSDSPQTIQTGDCSSILFSQSLVVTPQYNQELGRVVSIVSHNNGVPNNTFLIETGNVKPGAYRVSIGILPSQDNLLNQFRIVISGYNENNEWETLFDPMEELPVPPFVIQKTYKNDGHAEIRYDTISSRPGRINVETTVISIGYDSVLIVDSLVIPENIKRLRVQITNIDDTRSYSRTMSLDRVFFEPLDKDLPQQRYAGPFTEDVFNNATLYVPEGTVDVYRNADGWKLFKNISVDTKVYPVEELEVTVTDAGYATFYYSDADYALPQGLKAMVVSDIDAEGRLVYTTIADAETGAIPAGTAVILATEDGKGGVFKLQIAGSYSYSGNNLLMGTDVSTTTYGPGRCYFYKLSLGPTNTELSGVPGWYWASADGGAFTIDAHKAWLAIPRNMSKAARGYSLSGNPTSVTVTNAANAGVQIYDLNGRIVPALDGNGIGIIDSRKVIIIE